MKPRILNSNFFASAKPLMMLLFLNQIITGQLHAQSNYRIIHSFGSITNDGANPTAGPTLSGSTLYGTTYAGGSSGNGTVFKVNTDVALRGVS